jgi:drug/metabolite transporter (DMT)-like permease
MSALEPGLRDPRYPSGVAMVMLAGVCLSSGGLIVRHIGDADGWQILFFRSLAFSVTVFVLVCVRNRGWVLDSFRRIGWNGAAVAVSLGLGFSFYLFGLLLTTVANVVFTVSTSPLFTALLGWAVLGERVSVTTWAVIGAALAGVTVMFAESLSAGLWLGNLVALGAPLLFAVTVVALRRAHNVDMLPATCLGGLVAAALAAIMAEGLVIPARDLGLSVLLGVGQIGAGFTLITLGARYVPAAQVALLSLTEVVLAPLWVWIFVGETPGALSLLGGCIVVGAVAIQAAAGLRRGAAAAVP